MSSKTILENSTLNIDVEKEFKRWNQFFTIMNEPEPSVDQTPRQVVWKKNKAVLWFYPAVERKYNVPLFIVYSLFNRSYILDLAPGSSVIEGLTKAGYDVYMLDWGIPGYEDKDINIDNYIIDYIKKGVQRSLRHSKAKEISLVGYCLGGTLAAIYAALAEEPIKNLAIATVPIDFSFAAMPEKWAEAIKNGTLNIDKFIDVYGVIPAKTIESMFRAITSPIYNSPYFALLNRAYDKKYVDRWLRMNKWTSEHVPFTGSAFRQLYNDFFKENKLVKGELIIRGQEVNLAKIESNLLVVSSKNDHLVPKEQSEPIMDLVSSQDKTYQLVEAGHISLAITGKFSKILDQWLSDRSCKILNERSL